MRYYSAILTLIFLNCIVVISLLHLGNVSRDIEKKNFTLEKNIRFINDQVNINEIEFSLYHDYNYLKKLQKIYFKDQNQLPTNNILSFNDVKKGNLDKIIMADMR